MEHLGAIARDGSALADAAERAGLDAPVASCPGWTVADLVWHTGEVHVFFRSCTAGRWTDPSAYVEPERPLGDLLVPWYREGVQQLVDVLRDTPPDAPVWSWAPRGGTAAWVVRRMAQETAVHRWDAESAASASPPPIDAELAVDGIDEFFEHFSDSAAEGAAPVGGTVHLHATDAVGEWLASEPTVGGRIKATKEHAKGDAAVRGTASDLLLLLWRRLDLDGGSFEVFGDTDVARRLVSRPDLR
jgi:uncharacterized protein (TIGR03083 family)